LYSVLRTWYGAVTTHHGTVLRLVILRGCLIGSFPLRKSPHLQANEALGLKLAAYKGLFMIISNKLKSQKSKKLTS